MKNNYMNLFLIKSKWPFLVSLNTMFFMMNLIMMLNKMIKINILIMILMLNLLMMNNWISNILMEKFLLGMKIMNMITYLKMFIYLIILSELMFFLTFFYLNFSMKMFNNNLFNMNLNNFIKLNFMLSLLNLLILLTSSMSMMIFINKNLLNKINSNIYLNMTIILGTYFLFIQLIEYKMMMFNISNSIFFSNFYLLTFFHMNHVIMGIMILMNFNFFYLKYLISNKFKMKMICWYWHFIDLIWMFIFIIIY